MNWDQWLIALFEHTEGLVELRALSNVRGQGRPDQDFTRDWDRLEAFVTKYNIPGYGLYVGMGTRYRRRGMAKDVRELTVLWADIDGVPKGAILAALQRCPYPPTAIVDSGRGLHLYWFLDEPCGPSVKFVTVLKGLRRIFSGDPAVCDLARVMRLPSTFNTKYGDPLPVHVVEHHETRRYSFDDLAEWAADGLVLVSGATNPWQAAAEAMGYTKALDLGDMGPGNIHRIQRDYAWKMLHHGVPAEQILAAIMQATRIAAGEAGAAWDWGQEEKKVVGLITTAQEKIEPVDLGKEREKRRKTAPDGKQHVIVAVARLALEAWGRPLITVGVDLWTYEGGIWHRFDAVWEKRLRDCIQGAAAYIGAAPTGSTLTGAYRWIYDNPDLARTVTWDRAGVLVGDNGALVIESGAVVPHSSEHYATRRTECALDADAQCPRWLEFVASTVPEGAGPSLQEWMGAALVRGKSREMSKGLIVYGPSRTGKTVITEVARALLGGITCGVRVRDLGTKFGREPLLTASGWVADDAVGMYEQMDAEGYKQIVTGEQTSVQRKNKPNVEISFDLPVLLTMNNFPIVKDDSDAVYNRSGVLPMTRIWAEEEATQYLGQAIVTEELAGVLNWALAGWHRLRARGWFDFPEVMIAAGKEFRGQNNSMDEFLELCVEPAKNGYVMRTEFARMFNSYLKTELIEKAWSGKRIAITLAKNGQVKALGDRIHRGRVWLGIAFTEAALAYQEREFGQPEPTLSTLNFRVTAEMRAARK